QLGRFDAVPQRRLDRLRLVLRLRRPVSAGLPRVCLRIPFLAPHSTPFILVKSMGTDTLSAKTMICTRERGWLRLAAHPFGTNLPSVTQLHFPKQAHEDRAAPTNLLGGFQLLLQARQIPELDGRVAPAASGHQGSAVGGDGQRLDAARVT